MSKLVKPFLIVAVLLVIGAFALLMIPRGNTTIAAFKGVSAEVFYSPTCGCCINYMGHVRDGGLEVIARQTDTIDTIKDQFKIPAAMRSCHTMEIDRYFVEGHIPREAIQKLMTEKPDIDGIALRGMPSGSPGMPGIKQGPFEVYAIKNGQVQGLFMKV